MKNLSAVIITAVAANVNLKRTVHCLLSLQELNLLLEEFPLAVLPLPLFNGDLDANCPQRNLSVYVASV